MNKLFFLSAYSQKQNEWVQFFVAVENEEDAREEVEKSLAYGWKIDSCEFVCDTPDDLFKEF